MNPTADRRGPQLTMDRTEGRRRRNARHGYRQYFCRGSGHPGGTLSVMDIAAALYLNVLNHDPANPAGRSAIAFSGRRDTKLPHCMSPWAEPDISRWTM